MQSCRLHDIEHLGHVSNLKLYLQNILKKLLVIFVVLFEEEDWSPLQFFAKWYLQGMNYNFNWKLAKVF